MQYFVVTPYFGVKMARTKRHFIPGYVFMFQPVITCQYVKFHNLSSMLIISKFNQGLLKLM